MGQYAQYRQPNFTGVATTPAATDRQRKKLLLKRGSARLRIPCCCWMTWALHATSALRMSGVSQSIGPQLPAITRFMHTRAPIEFLDRLKSCLLTGVPPKNKVAQVVSAALDGSAKLLWKYLHLCFMQNSLPWVVRAGRKELFKAMDELTQRPWLRLQYRPFSPCTN